MATTIYPDTWSFLGPHAPTGVSTYEVASTIDFFSPYASLSGSHITTVINKVWDTVAAGWVRWVTDYEDVDGVLYPGPGSFGVDTSQYRIESITFLQEQ